METAAATAAETTMNIGVSRIPSAWLKTLWLRIPCRAYQLQSACLRHALQGGVSAEWLPVMRFVRSKFLGWGVLMKQAEVP